MIDISRTKDSREESTRQSLKSRTDERVKPTERELRSLDAGRIGARREGEGEGGGE